MAVGLQCPQDVALLLRGDATEHGGVGDRTTELGGVVGQGAGVDHPVRAGYPHFPGDGADRLRLVARDDLGDDPLFCEEPQGVGGVVPDPIAESDERNRCDVRGKALIEGRVGVCQEQDASATPRPVGRALGDFTIVRGEHVGPAQHETAPALEGRSAPFASAGERGDRGRSPAGRCVIRRPDGGDGRVGMGVDGGEGGEGGFCINGRLEHLELVHDQDPLGQGSGLVEADRVDPRQPLDGRELLYEHVAATQPDDTDGERHRRQEHETLRNHPDRTGDAGAERLEEGRRLADDVRLLPGAVPDEQHDHRQDRPRHDAQDGVDAVPELGVDEGELLRLAGERCRVGVGADSIGDEAPGACDHEGSREDRVADVLHDRIRLAREQRFVDLEPAAVHDGAVDRDLVARGQLDEVADHDLLDGGGGRDSLADRGDGRRRQDGETVERLLRPQLLDDADGGVRHHHDAEQRVPRLAHRDQDHDEQDRQQDVEAGDDVGADDLLDGATRIVGEGVDLTGGDPGPHLFPRQSLGSRMQLDGVGHDPRIPGALRRARGRTTLM